MPASATPGETPSKRGVKKQAGLKRTRTGCLTCRKRRHKCGEEKPACSRCIKGNLDCIWQTDVPLEAKFQPYLPFESQPSTAATSPEAYRVTSTTYSSWSPTASEAFPSSSQLHFGGATLQEIDSKPFDSQALDFHPFGGPFGSAAVARPPVAERTVETWSGSGLPLYLSPSSSLEVVFPDPQERGILQHFLLILPTLFSIPPRNSRSNSSSHQPPANNAFSRFMPALDCARFLSTPRGQSTANDALALALLSAGAVHLSFLHRQNALSALARGESRDANDALSRTQRYMALSHNLERGSCALQHASILLLDPLNPLSTSNVHESLDLVLVAGSIAMLTQCLAGLGGWKEVVELGKSIVGMRGGPIGMLEAARRTGDRLCLRRTRCMLEELLGWDIFGSLASGVASETFAGHKTASWYFRYVPEPTENPYQIEDASSDDWDTVESMMGISRGVVEILDRVNLLYSKSRQESASLRSPSAPDPPLDPHCLSEAYSILAELDVWRSQIFQVFPAAPEGLSRLQLGNCMCLDFLAIILYMDILGYSQSDHVIQSLAGRIIDYFDVCNREHGLILGLMWPLIVAGSVQPSQPESARARFRDAMDCMRECCCFDLDEGKRLMEGIWAVRDGGDTEKTWRDVVRSEGILLI